MTLNRESIKKPASTIDIPWQLAVFPKQLLNRTTVKANRHRCPPTTHWRVFKDMIGTARAVESWDARRARGNNCDAPLFSFRFAPFWQDVVKLIVFASVGVLMRRTTV